jgi:hypothetical protein
MALQETLNKPMADPFGVASKTRAAEQAKADVGVELAQKQEQEMKPILAAERQKMDEVGARQAQIGQQMEKPFEIPKETMGDFAQLAGLVAIAGTMVGASGKQSANNVLGAMTGIMEGYKSGRKDLIANSYKEFDTNMKRLQGLQKQIDSELTLYLQKSSTNREEAKTHLATATALANQGIAAKIADGQSADKVAQLLQQNAKMQQAERHHQDNINKAKPATTKGSYELYRDKDGNLYSIDKVTGDKKLVEGSEGFTKASGKETSADSPRSATNERYANTVIRSSNEVLRSLSLVEKVGLTGGRGVLGGVVGKGSIPTELAAAGSQALTTESQKNYNAAMGGVSLELAYVLNGGYKPDAETTKKLETLYAVGPSDTTATAAFKFADIVAKLEAAIEVTPAYTPEQKKNRELIVEKLKRYATPEEVYDAFYGANEGTDPRVRAGVTGETPGVRPEEKIATQADVDATMKANKLTRAEVVKKLKAAGYKVQGE